MILQQRLDMHVVFGIPIHLEQSFSTVIILNRFSSSSLQGLCVPRIGSGGTLIKLTSARRIHDAEQHNAYYAIMLCNGYFNQDTWWLRMIVLNDRDI